MRLAGGSSGEATREADLQPGRAPRRQERERLPGVGDRIAGWKATNGTRRKAPARERGGETSPLSGEGFVIGRPVARAKRERGSICGKSQRVAPLLAAPPA